MNNKENNILKYGNRQIIFDFQIDICFTKYKKMFLKIICENSDLIKRPFEN